jgi:Pvc16 N-terminal domain
MIDEVLRQVVGSMNQFFRSRYGLNEDAVVLSGLVNADGTPALLQDNKVVVTLLNIEPEKVTSLMGNQFTGSGRTSGVNPPVYINLHVLFSGYFPGSNYAEALRFIAGVIAFFQANVSMQRTDSGAQPPEMDKLVFEMQKFSYLELNQVWGMLGAKHMPSVCYRIRLLSVDEKQLKEQRPSVSEVPPNVNRI